MGLSRSRENEINSELSIIASRNVIETVVDTLGVDTVLGGKPPQDDTDKVKRKMIAVRKIERNLHVESEKKSNNISAKFDSTDPQLAQVILNEILEAYQHRHIEVYRSQASLRFFKTRVDNLLEKIEKKEAVLAAFQREHNLTSPARQKEQLTTQIMNMQNRSDEIKRTMMSLHARRNILEKSLADRTPYAVTSRVEGMPNRSAETLKERLVELRIREADIIAGYPETSTTRKQLLEPVQRSIRVVEESLKKESNTLTEETTGIDSGFREMTESLRETKTELSELSAEQAAIGPMLEERREQLDAMIEIEHDMKKMQRDIGYDRDEYKQYRTGLQRTKVAEALDIDQISNVSIVQSAILPANSISPDKPRNLALGLVISIMAGIGIAFVREHFDDTIKSEADVIDHLEQIVLADISIEEFEQCR
jgi:tyrosine-protein kinase Etk/Wzc